jgi:hypothetical protein
MTLTRARHFHPHVEIVALAKDAWRVCDDRLPENDASRLIGYVEEGDGFYELMWIRSVPGSCDRFTSLSAALDAVSLELDSERVDVRAARRN